MGMDGWDAAIIRKGTVHFRPEIADIEMTRAAKNRFDQYAIPDACGIDRFAHGDNLPASIGALDTRKVEGRARPSIVARPFDAGGRAGVGGFGNSL